VTPRNLGTAAAVATLLAGSVIGATPASAQENFRGSVTFPADAPVVECDGGVGIGLTFDIDFTFHWTYDESALVRERLTLRYTGYFENLDTGERSTPVRGTGNTVTDYADGTRTTSGSGRSMTMPGVGTVLHEAGHAVFDLETGQLLVSHGPTVNEATPEGAQLVCSAMGLTGGVPLEPPDVHD
jgi:hypothetical protein